MVSAKNETSFFVCTTNNPGRPITYELIFPVPVPNPALASAPVLAHFKSDLS